jgi:hypothetical protein
MRLFRFSPFILAALVSGACGDDETSSPNPDTSADVTEPGDTTTGSDGSGHIGPDAVSFVRCEPFGQDVCGEGETCSYLGNDAEAVCVPSGPVETGELCAPGARCAEGVCMALNGTDARCFDFCRDTNDCGGDICIALSNAAFSVCRVDGLYPPCTLLAQDCDEGLGCYAVRNEPAPVCLEAGEAAAGETCEFADSCVRGAACVNGTCRDLCDPAAEASCEPGFLCTTINDTDVGYCAPS